MMANWKIQGQTFLITGGASGLGAGQAEALLKEGAKSIAILDVAEDAGRTTADRLSKAYNTNVLYIKCDVSDEESVTQAFEKVVNEFSKLDVVINNAGIMNDSPGRWRKMCDVNVKGLVSITMKGLKYMRKDEGGLGGTIINMSSVLGLDPLPYLPIYSGTKSAVLQFGRCLSAESPYEETGVRILTICFGATDTPLLHNLNQLGYDEKCGKKLQKTVGPDGYHLQSPDSAVRGCIDMMKKGSNGSIWVATDDKPAKDITHVIDAAYNDIKKAVFS